MVGGVLPLPIMEHEDSVSVQVSQEYYIHWKFISQTIPFYRTLTILIFPLKISVENTNMYIS